MLYFMIGQKLNTNQLLNIGNGKMFFFLTIIFVFLSAYSGALSLVRNYYSCFIINFPASVLAFISLYKCSVYIVKKNYAITNIICKTGRISILILCIHIVEMEFDPIPYYIEDYVNIDSSIYVTNPLCHIVIACTLALLLQSVPFIRNIYNLR